MTGEMTAAKNVFSKCKIKLRFEKTKTKTKRRQRAILGIPGKQLFLWARLSQSGKKHKIKFIHPIIVL